MSTARGASPVISHRSEPISSVAPTHGPIRLKTRFYLDVAPLQETEWTGIPHVAAKLAEQLLGDLDIEPRFFYNRHEIPADLIEKLLNVRNGSILRWAAGRYVFKPALSDPRTADRIWGLHTNIKFARRLFPVEGVMVHDLTTLVTPQHHTEETNKYHQTKFFGDLMSSDIIFTVSHSTAKDVTDFYPETRDIPMVVSHLGVDWGHIPVALRADSEPLEDYLLVLGTLEPRKNVGIVLDLLKARPSLTENLRIVFGGRVGWGKGFEAELEARDLTPLLDQGRILQTGFITEAAKYTLFKHARAVIYPSVYEGFGLPVAEAISLGSPVVTTASSSLPEVGRDFAHYFLAGDTESLFRAISRALARGHSTVSPSGETLDEWLRYFSWARCYRTIKDGFRRLESSRAPCRFEATACT